MGNVAVESGARSLKLGQLSKGISASIRARRVPNKDLGDRDGYTFVVVQRRRLVEKAGYVIGSCLHASFILEEIEVGFDVDLYTSKHRGRLFEFLWRVDGLVGRLVAGKRHLVFQIVLSIENVIARRIFAGKFA